MPGAIANAKSWIRRTMNRRIGVSSVGELLFVVIRAVLLIGMCYIIVFPMVSKISSSFMSGEDIYDNTVRWIPRRPTLNNYRDAFYEMEYGWALLRSLALAIAVGALSLMSCTLVGYGLARYRFPGRELIFAGAILTLVIPPSLLMIPMYMNFRFFNLYGLLPEPGVNLLNSFWPFLMTSATATGLRNGLFIYIMRQYFSGMPRNLEEAAYIDGAGPIRTFFSVMLPCAPPALMIVFLFSFVWQWNDYFYTSIYMAGTNVLPMALSQLRQDFITQLGSPIVNAGSVMFILPILIIFAFLQRYFVESVDRTGLVG